MINNIENTETLIINAAREVFIRKGYDGARMQEIADEAGINKSLLHYYFRSKDKLFDQVFRDTFSGVIDAINHVYDNSVTLDEFIENFVVNYTKTLKSKPFIPNFVLHELSRNPQRVVSQITSTHFNKQKMVNLIANDPNLNMKNVHPVHIITDIIALCIFPFVARPMLEGLMFGSNTEAYLEFLAERPDHIIEFVKNAIYKK